MGLDRSEVHAGRREARAHLFRDILERRALSCVFQPILSLHGKSIYGYEALIRGPKDSLFQSPVDLFDAAEDTDSVVELSVICVNTVLHHFSAQRLPGKLFLNLSPSVVTAPGFDPVRGENLLSRLGLKPDQVIIELTEHHPTYNFKAIQDSLQTFKAMGFQVAIDDLGEGFSSLRLWSELKPAYVKADKHFVKGIADDPIKLQFLKAMQQIAESCGSQIIAEGIENEADFKTVRELGIAFGQGYLIGRPEERPKAVLSAAMQQLLADGRVPVPPTLTYRQSSVVCAQQFLREASHAMPHTPVRELIDIFEREPSCYAIPVVENSRPIGLVARRHVRFIKTIADPAAAAYAQCARDIMNIAPLIVDRTLPVLMLAHTLARSTPQHLADGFIITDEGRYLGMGAATDVLRVIADTQLTAARYTHPLTFLPGPVPANEQIDRLLKGGQRFTACLVEVEPMKGFNDAFGYQRGDDLIRMAGSVLAAAVEERHDLVGHIYGNRFVLLMQSPDWRLRVETALAAFRSRLADMLSTEILERGSIIWVGRRGQIEFRPVPRMAIGAVLIAPEQCESRHEVMALAREAAVHAREQPGSGMVVDQKAAGTPGVASAA